MLIDQLPPESATFTAVRNANPDATSGADPAQAPWSRTEMLLAAAVDGLNRLAWMYASAHSKSSLTPPQPIPRPGVGPKRLTPAAAEWLFR
ncbi:MAG TPA: hypothetical protein VFM01_05185, partial [Nakamurella sp.]|nr:hypothetical protein [Nakamurella sp.]